MTTQDDVSSLKETLVDAAAEVSESGNGGSLRSEVQRSLSRYFEQLDGQPVSDLYEMVINEVEAPLFAAVMQYTQNNQSKASITLGLNRGTLRKKLKQYGLL